MLPRPTIEAFDRHLLELGLRFEGVVIGGSALGLMGIVQRPTRTPLVQTDRVWLCDLRPMSPVRLGRGRRRAVA